MNYELDNPFSVTKATEFSDIEILEYWVNFNTKDNVSINLNPNEFMPKYLIGGKGCGKTHILRYYSFPLQKIRYSGDISKLLKQDKYLGIYSVFHGINSSRFVGKGISEEEWNAVFKYYFELYICDNLLGTIREIVKLLDIPVLIEKQVIISILSLFSNYRDIIKVENIPNLIDYLAELRRRIDSQVLNAAFTRKLEYEEIKVLFSPGDLLFGIPRIIADKIEQLNEVKFIYIFDEYEKLFEWQKKFINTIVWDKRKPVTFWIGARRYGYTTRETESGQVMRPGSEFDDINLDYIIRSNEEIYNDFATELYLNRLLKYYQSKKIEFSRKALAEEFSKKFESYNEQKLLSKIIDKYQVQHKEYMHIKELRKKILAAVKAGYLLDLDTNSKVEEVIQSILWGTDNNPLLQKYKLFFFYRKWYSENKKLSINKALSLLNSEFEKFLNNSESKFDEIVDKRKKDMIAQLTKESNIKNTEYSGINEFIRISQGNARSFLLALKKVIEYAKIRGEKPLDDGGKISLESQFFAVFETARWFYEDIELVGESGRNMYTSLRRLSDYFIIERYCDKPVETTVSCFYINAEGLSQRSLSNIDTMLLHSVLIEDIDGRKEKTTGRKYRLFQINKVLAPLWNLPTVVRGSISLSSEVAEVIFNPDISEKKFKQIYNNRKSQLNAPDFLKWKKIDEQGEIKFFKK
jgi:hypothetical protein